MPSVVAAAAVLRQMQMSQCRRCSCLALLQREPFYIMLGITCVLSCKSGMSLMLFLVVDDVL